MKIALTVNGLHVEAHYHDDEIEKVHKPLLQQLAKIHAAKPERRTIVFLSAPPGTGKSTLTTFWEYLSRQDAGLPEIQTLPMDGFHYYNRWLEAHHLRACKGAPETLRARLIGRKLAGGLSQAEAETFYERTDGPNVRRVLESSLPADLMLEMTSTGEYRMACP
ncbi:hypothetical protein IEI71_003001 [Salmonella enterica]|nr:hypothetical protein [Salmonella enterica]EGH4397346.1 hypothetical protein [Salmonella enterica]